MADGHLSSLVSDDPPRSWLAAGVDPRGAYAAPVLHSGRGSWRNPGPLARLRSRDPRETLDPRVDPLLFWQLAALMHKAGRDYIVFERNAVAGSFFLQYPRHRVLNGINRVNTGSDDPEVNMLQDWHSLILDDPELRFGKYVSRRGPSGVQQYACGPFELHAAAPDGVRIDLVRRYSSELYPKADDLVRYLSAVVSKLKLNVVFNTNVQSIEKPPGAGSSFQVPHAVYTMQNIPGRYTSFNYRTI